MKRVLCIWLIISGIAFAADFEPKGPLAAATEEASFDAKAAERFAKLALACVHKEYPNKIAHVLNSDADVAPPRKLTPAFCGCYDWHSSVHGHWLLVRLLRTFPDAPFAVTSTLCRASGMGRSASAGMVGEFKAARGRGRGTFDHLAAKAFTSGPRRRT